MNWLRGKLRKWLIGDVDEKLALVLQAMKAIEAQGLEKIQQEMGSMFFTFTHKQVPVKVALLELMRYLQVYLSIAEDHKGELYPVIKQIRKPVTKPKLKKGA